MARIPNGKPPSSVRKRSNNVTGDPAPKLKVKPFKAPKVKNANKTTSESKTKVTQKTQNKTPKKSKTKNV